MSIISKEKQKKINNEAARKRERAKFHQKINDDVDNGKQHILNHAQLN